MTPNQPIVEQHQRTFATVTDTLTDEVTPVVVATETMAVDAATGSTAYTTTTNYVLTADSRITPIEKTFTCRGPCKTRFLSETVRRPCSTCGKALCRVCAQDPPFCTVDRWKNRLHRLWQWLTSF